MENLRKKLATQFAYAWKEFRTRIFWHLLVLLTGILIAYALGTPLVERSYYSPDPTQTETYVLNGFTTVDRLWSIITVLSVFITASLITQYRVVKYKTWDNPVFLIEINLSYVLLLAAISWSWWTLLYGLLLGAYILIDISEANQPPCQEVDD